MGVRKWIPSLHPRGGDGKFIKSGGGGQRKSSKATSKVRAYGREVKKQAKYYNTPEGARESREATKARAKRTASKVNKKTVGRAKAYGREFKKQAKYYNTPEGAKKSRQDTAKRVKGAAKTIGRGSVRAYNASKPRNASDVVFGRNTKRAARGVKKAWRKINADGTKATPRYKRSKRKAASDYVKGRTSYAAKQYSAKATLAAMRKAGLIRR